ncbi:MAG: hypothetical protein LBS69_12665 [Prevotellaceae bacterium]|jgi:hypothetical protein|nr:hypothetical protein [Prevotellaceae bacterium]
MKNIIGIVFIFCATNLSAQTAGIRIPQLPVPTVPMPQVPNPYNHQLNRQQQPNMYYNHDEHLRTQKQNEAIINEDIYMRHNVALMLINTGFPSQSYKDPKGTEFFYQAFEEISAMLKGEKSLNLGRTVFLVENAFYGNALNYSDYQNFLKRKVQFYNQKIKEEKLNGNDNLVKNMMLFRLISDTLKFKNTGIEKTLTHLPVKYDYDDYNSKNSYDSHFVTKLMRTGIGQCYSMPLYYLILAEEIKADAYWSFSPRHSFIKIQDKKGAWYNLELTCNAILSDAHYMNSGYIKAEAIRNKLYLEPLDKTNIVAEMLINLARYYYVRYGFDDFYLKCLDTAMQYLSNNLNALIPKAHYQTQLVLTIADLLDAQNPEILKKKSSKAYMHYEKMQKLYKQIDDLGYEEFPDELYTKWLDYIAKQKAEQQKTFSMDEIK